MKLVIDIPNEIYKDIMIHNREMREGGKSAYYFEELIQNGKPLPDNATNGNMIKAIFPKAWKSNYIDSDNKCTLYIDDDELEVDIDWWNAPYRKETKDADSN